MLAAMGMRCLVVFSLIFIACGGPASVVRPGQDAGRAARGTVVAQTAPPSWNGTVRKRCRAVEPLILSAASRHALDAALVAGIIRVESTFRPRAVSRAGALGLMQVMPQNGRNLECGDLLEPEANIECGIRVLEGFLRYYDDHIIYALSGYNAGFAAPNRARAAGTIPSNFSYVEKVLAARASYMRAGCGS